MVITGATGAIGSVLVKHFRAIPFDIRGEDKLPKTSVLINCFGMSRDAVSYKPYNGLDTLVVNLCWTMDIISMALPYMREQGYGRIINMSSMLANQAVWGTTAYTASKAGLNAAIRVMAKENAKYNVLINNLNLGYMDLGMTHKIKNQKKLKKQIPAGKFGDVSEIIRACEFLIDSNYITGSCIDINGGLW